MRIWHVGAGARPDEVNGVVTAAWLIAGAQAAAGHHCTMVAPGGPARPQQVGGNLSVRGGGYRDLRALANAVRRTDERPDIVHFHSAWTTTTNLIGVAVRQAGVPYVVSPQGGYFPQIMRRHRVQKSLYAVALERPHVRGASAVGALNATDEAGTKAFLRSTPPTVVQIPNPVDPSHLDGPSWQGPKDPPTVVYLGRFDVEHKGIDVLFAMATLLPEASFRLYGPHGQVHQLARLSRPANVAVLPPVFGAEKRAVLASASMYVQASRWDAFPLSVVEALSAGVPCAMSRGTAISDVAAEHDIAVVLSEDAVTAAEQLRATLADEHRLLQLGERARAYALQHFAPTLVAEAYLELYAQTFAPVARQT